MYFGWIELRALPNRAQRWVKEQVEAIATSLPFTLYGVDSDNGSEFINYQLLSWCTAQHLQFTRSRSNHKNDNCFVEQKNDVAVHRTVGYARFASPDKYEALRAVYESLCPLVNFYYPSMKLLNKIRIGSQVKKVYDSPKTPYQRLLESPLIDEQTKATIRQRAMAFDPVKQKLLVNRARAALFSLHEHSQHDPPLPKPRHGPNVSHLHHDG